ncbi:MAG: hypothetical protein K9W43_12465 [Candidatus Thorarchaeota archaeon]|nr:hypothetical protein [Candidatus Thorarchaeota archaeon]
MITRTESVAAKFTTDSCLSVLEFRNFDPEEIGERKEMEESVTSSNEEEELLAALRKQSKQAWRRGAGLIVIGVILTVPILLMELVFSNILYLVSVIIGTLLALIGGFQAEGSAKIESYFLQIRILKTINQEPVITKEYAVTRVADVIIFAVPTTIGSLYFVRDDRINAQTSEKIIVPKNFLKLGYRKLAGYKVHRRKGQFAIPTPEGAIITTNSELIRLPTTTTDYYLHPKNFTRERLMELITAISNGQFNESS